MFTFVIGLAVLLLGGYFYGKFCERVFHPDRRTTPAYAMADGVNYVPMKKWKNALIELLNIAGTGPVLGPIQGILFGPIAFVLIPVGCVLGGAVHDYFSGMLSLRNKGEQMPGLMKRFMGNGVFQIYNVFVCLLMFLVGVVFVYTPGDMLAGSVFGFTTSFTDASTGETTTVKLGVVGSIYEDLWAPAKEALKEEGIDLEIVQFSDYVTPNNALANGEIDLNAFQHRIYLQSEVENYGYEIQAIGNTFIIPLNLYSDKVSSVDELKDGDTVAIPDDLTNGGRALKVLESAGLITLKADAGFSPTVDDIETYNTKIQIEELKANVIPSSLPDVTAAVVNGNYALDFGLKTEEAIYKDSVLDEEQYWNLIAARTADLKDPTKVDVYKKVVAAFQSDATEKVFHDDFGGYFIKVGWDQDLFSEAQ